MLNKSFITKIKNFHFVNYLQSNSKMEILMNSNNIEKDKIKIAIIGSGISGLECAAQLSKEKENNYSITIFEANNIIGGRIKKQEGFCDYPVELGAEEIHGKNSYYYKTAIKQGAKPFEYWDLDKFYCYYDPNNDNDDDNYNKDINEEKHKLEKIYEKTAKYPDLKFIEDIFEDISYEKNNKKMDFPNVTIADYLRKNNINEKAYFYADALFGTECGSEIERVSLSGFFKICDEWESGVENFCVVNMSHWDILRKNYSEIIEGKRENVKLILNCPIEKIDLSQKDFIKISNDKKIEYNFDKCILTVPLTQYKKINFIPNLSKEKIEALNRIGFDSTAKIILKFSKCIWPEDAAVILIPGIVNFWTASYLGKNSNDFVLYSLVAGKNCRTLTNLYRKNKDEFLDKIFEDFEKVFGKNCRRYLSDYIWFDWTEQPYIEGGYSFISVDEKENDRNLLQEDIDRRLFFAGEAFGKNGHIATIHGAIDTAVDLCNKILNMN
jgi:polyamine oxidase